MVIERYSTSPFGDDPGGEFTFSDATLVALMGMATLVAGAVFLLGAVCAEHRIAAALWML